MKRKGVETKMVIFIIGAVLLGAAVLAVAANMNIDACSMYFLVEQVSNSIPGYSGPSCPFGGG